MIRRPPRSTLFPTRRSSDLRPRGSPCRTVLGPRHQVRRKPRPHVLERELPGERREPRSEEHTSELQSLTNLVCRLLLEKKKNHTTKTQPARLHVSVSHTEED